MGGLTPGRMREIRSLYFPTLVIRTAYPLTRESSDEKKKGKTDCKTKIVPVGRLINMENGKR